MVSYNPKLSQPVKRSGQNLLKRRFDFIVALAFVTLFAPVYFILWVLVRITLGGPVIFKQKRPGLHGRIFTLYKFRTMRDLLGPDGQPLPDEQRLTRIGEFLRKSSLDELPEMINVLRGEMSLVGPRPLLVEYLERYDEIQKRRHEVRPGITGLAQVSGRNELDWEKRFAMDVWYVDHQSFALDLKILARTVLKVVKAEGISKKGHATMSRFMGKGSL